jgi:hypothetical protein
MCVFIYLRHVAISARFSMMDEAWNWKVGIRGAIIT